MSLSTQKPKVLFDTIKISIANHFYVNKFQSGHRQRKKTLKTPRSVAHITLPLGYPPILQAKSNVNRELLSFATIEAPNLVPSSLSLRRDG